MALKTATIVPFGSTRYPTYTADADPNLAALLDTGAKTVTIFGKSWRLHATEVLRVTAEENLELIESSVRYLVDNGREVIYDAEHFFDGYADDAAYAMETLRAAATGGASCLVLCDTNGGRLPLEIQEGVKVVLSELHCLSVSIPTTTQEWGQQTQYSPCKPAQPMYKAHSTATVNGAEMRISPLLFPQFNSNSA